MTMHTTCVYTSILLVTLYKIAFASQGNAGLNYHIPKENETTKYEMGIDSIIISGDVDASEAPDAITVIVENVTYLSTEPSVTDNSVTLMSPKPTTNDTNVTEDEDDDDATEGYTEPTRETSSINSVEEIYEMKERLSLLEARVRLLEHVNLVWWNNFRQMGAPLPKKTITV